MSHPHTRQRITAVILRVSSEHTREALDRIVADFEAKPEQTGEGHHCGKVVRLYRVGDKLFADFLVEPSFLAEVAVSAGCDDPGTLKIMRAAIARAKGE